MKYLLDDLPITIDRNKTPNALKECNIAEPKYKETKN